MSSELESTDSFDEQKKEYAKVVDEYMELYELYAAKLNNQNEDNLAISRENGELHLK